MAKGRISILFMNNVTWKSYYFIAFFFWCCVMLVLEIMFASPPLFTSSVASVIVAVNLKVISIPFISWVYFALASIETVAFGLFISSIFSSPSAFSSALTPSFLAVCLNILLNLPGYFPLVTMSQSALCILPLSSLVVICYDMISPNGFGTAAMRSTLITSAVMTVVYLAIGYVVWFLRIDVGQIVDRFYQKKHVKGGYVEMENATLVMDEDVAKEEESIRRRHAGLHARPPRGKEPDGAGRVQGVFHEEGRKQVFPPISFCVKDYEV